MHHTPIDVGSRKQLLFDELLVASKRDISLVVNKPYQDPDPVLVADRPWESGGIGSYNTVMCEDGVFRMWYDALMKPGDRGARFDRQLCYAESTDGVHWEKPELGLIRFGRSKRNNIVSPPSGTQSQQGATVFRDDQAPKSERYKAWTKLNPAFRQTSSTRSGGLRALVSPDGLRWKFLDEGYPLHKGNAADSQNIAFWDEEQGCYVAYVRMKRLPRGRDRTCWVGRMTSRDFRNWTRAKTVFAADKTDEAMPLPAGTKARQPVLDFYTPGGMKYPGAPSSYLLFPSAYHHWDEGRFPGTIDVILLTSRDGIHWHRPSERAPYLRLGLDGSPNCGMLNVNPWPIVVGDEVWIYYGGVGRSHLEERTDPSESGLFRARLRLDGFMSADAPAGGGVFTTPPLTFEGDRLELNVDTSAGGWAQVEIRSGSGRPLSGFTQDACDVVRSNATQRIVTWNGSSDCSDLAGKPVRLRFTMRATKLYAFQFTSSL